MYTLLLSVLLMFSSACNSDDPLVVNPPNGEDEPKEETYNPDKFQNLPDISDVVMYEVNMRAFSNEGTFDGVTVRLDSIQALGVNVIWLMPIYPIGELKGVGSPYCVKDYKAVNEEYGTLTDLRELIEKAHELDMAVILDWVANHTAWDNEWIENDDWYTKDADGNIVQANDWTDVADLNFDSEEMRSAMIDAMKYWLDAANIDGYRCDYADGVPVDFWKTALKEVRDEDGRDLIFFAEGTRKENYSAGFDINFGWRVYGSIKGIIADNKPAGGLFTAHASDYTNVPDSVEMLHFITNHDDNAWDNTPDKLFVNQRGAMAAFVASTFVGGVLLIYNGQEIGYPYQLSFFTKTPINWNLNPEILSEYKKLMGIRKGNDAVRKGSLEKYSHNDVVAFKRVLGSEEVVVIVNVRNKAIDFNLPGELQSVTKTNLLTGENVELEETVQLGAFEYLILK
ncbi:MAG: alpha-amylase [Prolixibacteraceae bacterium]|nr:alpha-amylase [Prolixibacteraceae bacterium]